MWNALGIDAMRQTKSNAGPPKSQSGHRAPRRDGMKLVRIWVPDPSMPGFKESVARQAALLKGAAEEAEALTFIETAFAWPDP